MALYGHPELMEIPPAVRRRRCALVPARPSMSKTREPRVLRTVATSTNLRLHDERLLRTAEGRSMDTLIERCAGLDVHKETVVACVRVPARGGGREQSIQTFGTTTAQLLALRDWLVAHGVTRVGMESTGVYWKPVYYMLEDAVECWLLNARHLRNVPGRKTDVADAQWICQLVEHGLVRPSFVPPKPIRELRNLTRYRKAQVEERTREAQRLDKVLQDAGVKLSSVAGDILGKAGRQATLRQDPQGPQVAGRAPDRGGQGRRADQGHLPRRPVPAAAGPPRRGQGDQGGRPLDPGRRLPHPRPRPALPGPRRRLVRPPPSRGAGPQARQPAQPPRLPGHPQPHPGGLTTHNPQPATTTGKRPGPGTPTRPCCPEF